MPPRRPISSARKAPVSTQAAAKKVVVKKAVAKKAIAKPVRPAPHRPRGVQPHHVAAIWEFVAVVGTVLVAGLLALLITF